MRCSSAMVAKTRRGPCHALPQWVHGGVKDVIGHRHGHQGVRGLSREPFSKHLPSDGGLMPLARALRGHCVGTFAPDSSGVLESLAPEPGT